MDIDTAYKTPTLLPALRPERSPDYLSFDTIIDAERLRSLDAYIAHRIRRRMSQNRDPLYPNPYLLTTDIAPDAGVRQNSVRKIPHEPQRLNKTHVWELAPDATEFTMLMQFVKTLPFRSIGRVLLIYVFGSGIGRADHDQDLADRCREFIWMRTNLGTRTFTIDRHTGNRRPVDGYSAWFDPVGQFLWSEADEGLSFSLRVEGNFDDELRQRFPYCFRDRASAPVITVGQNGGSH